MINILGLCGAILAILMSGCGHEKSATDTTTARNELLIFCGAGLRPLVAELAETFGKENDAEVVIDYAGSELLISKAVLSRRGDIYMPGDKLYVDRAAAKGLILSQKPVCYFVPTILVQKGNPAGISGLKDLTRPGIKLGLGNAKYNAIGRQSKKIFAKNGIPWSNLATNLKFKSVTVNELGMQIQAGSLDAVIVWDAVARYYSQYGDAITIPYDQNVISTVDIGVLKFTSDRERAQQFVDFVCSERGRTIARKHEYQVDLPK